jgi:hypothetical protein
MNGNEISSTAEFDFACLTFKNLSGSSKKYRNADGILAWGSSMTALTQVGFPIFSISLTHGVSCCIHGAAMGICQNMGDIE